LPTRHGDLYAYAVEKYRVVDDVREDGSLVLVIRRGKRHIVGLRGILRTTGFAGWHGCEMVDAFVIMVGGPAGAIGGLRCPELHAARI
jgi:hypothetical protein